MKKDFNAFLSPSKHIRIFGFVVNAFRCRRLRLFVLGLSWLGLAACSTQTVVSDVAPSGVPTLKAVSVKGPVELKLKANKERSEAVDYRHMSASRAYEAGVIRQEKSEQLDFTAEATTVKPGDDRFTQVVKVTRKDGTLDLHEFAMPELGEQLEVTSTSDGRILKAGDYPSNSIYFVPPVSLPTSKVEVGDTWVMQSSWLSMGEMVPYELDMVSILKGFVECGNDTCADIEVSGNVSMQGALQQALVFRSEWRGRVLFAMGQGTVTWSRVNSEEIFAYDKIHRTVKSCLEAMLQPNELPASSEKAPSASIVKDGVKPQCTGFTPPTEVKNL